MQVATASENTPSKDLLRGMLALSMRTSSPLLPYRVGFLDCRSKHRERVGSHFSKDCSEERSNEIVCVRRCGNARQIHVETRWPATCLVRVGLQMSVLKASTVWGQGGGGVMKKPPSRICSAVSMLLKPKVVVDEACTGK